ncbi:fatty acyl-CoA reductase wat-like isoform X2 [Phlebotomus argentipes]|nr:fatty acyl-CoA reductase wat-like isoform X2 [Phlebotomus argentipes]
MTGGTGFLGKIIMEKIMRTCQIDTIYLLIRDKKGKDMHSRVEDLFDDVLYDRLRQQQPKFRHRIHPIAGDCSLPGLGISAHDRALLAANVHVVFHVAATVRFDEKLNIAMAINVSGTRELLALCREIQHLDAVVHVSTAYANCNRPDIDEKFYPHRISASNALQIYEALDADTLQTVGAELSKGWPNTYTFTKALAEDLIKSEGKGLPITIFRPAVVLPTAQEPIPGWIDNMYGPTGMMVGVAAGLIHVCHVHKDNNAELVPVDMCVNALLVSAWDRATREHEETPIINFVTKPGNKLPWIDYIDMAWKHGSQLPIFKSIWYAVFTVTDSETWFGVLWFLYHTLPAFFMDLCLRIVGKKPKMVDIYKKVKKYSDLIFFFTHMKFTFSCANVDGLWKRLTDRDREVFYFDMSSLQWDDYIRNNVEGIRQYLMKESASSIPAAKKRQARFKVLHYTIMYTIYALGFLLFATLLSKLLLPA